MTDQPETKSKNRKTDRQAACHHPPLAHRCSAVLFCVALQKLRNGKLKYMTLPPKIAASCCSGSSRATSDARAATAHVRACWHNSPVRRTPLASSRFVLADELICIFFVHFLGWLGVVHVFYDIIRRSGPDSSGSEAQGRRQLKVSRAARAVIQRQQFKPNTHICGR